ncbi:MAG TPA: B12-binding domain/radical SAM domain-containing protein [Pyrinomonadaceae bacterium]
MELRVVAVSAPEWPDGSPNPQVLTSTDPVSLFNACRVAAACSEDIGSPWAHSNWAGGRGIRRSKFLLLHSADSERMSELETLLLKERPNLLLIGAMSLCMPGAVACARIARAILGNNVLIVLGGRHLNETFFVDRLGAIRHHPASPLLLTSAKLLPDLFDIFVSGDGEYVIEAIGRVLLRTLKQGLDARSTARFLEMFQLAPGRWIAGTVSDGKIKQISGLGPDLDRDMLPAPVVVFGARARFDVFGGRITAHVFSDTGNGCVFDCDFCSERRSVSGVPKGLTTSAKRLHRQLAAANSAITKDSPKARVSAFVEDSTLLGGSESATRELVDLLSKDDLDIVFGAQYTIDQILRQKALIAELRDVGLRYLFVGLETFEPADAGGMHKDLSRTPWIHRAEEVFTFLRDSGLACGVAILFGIGENQTNRLRLLEQLADWRMRYELPSPISLNWAVQHPLKGQDHGAGYRYFEWGTPSGPYVEAFRNFGEASLNYCLPGKSPATLSELEEINAAYELTINERSVLECLSTP